MKKYIILTLFLIISPVLIFAQTMILDWADDEYELQIKIPEQTEALTVEQLYDIGIDIYADGLPVGSVISTNNTYAEFYLAPNGSIIKLSENTEFSIFQLESEPGGSNEFTLSGKLRMVAARATGSKKSRYNIRTESVICGVRGTDFILDSIADFAALKEGAINLLNEATGATVDLLPGQKSNLFGDIFTPAAIDAEALKDLFDSMSFKNLKPENVNQPEKEAEAEEEPKEEEKPKTADLPEEPEPAVVKTPKKQTALQKFLSENLGFEIGSITINGDTYAKAVIQPSFTIGKLSMALYLPIIYTENLFDPDDWHHPDGNDEWSFGTDQEGAEDIITDVLSDLFLKIKYVKWGDNRDKFFLKAGNLDDMTIGHGMLMKDYANDTNFPEIRKVGLNFGLDLGKFGFEAVITDMSDLEIFGGRMHFDAGDKLSFGISSIVDINPGDDVNPELTDTYGDPIFINAGVDLDISIVETDSFGIVLYADAAAMVPYLREDASIGGETVEKGIHFDAIFNPNTSLDMKDRIKNYGAKAGLFGNVSAVDWLAEFQFYNGSFRPACFNPTYDRLRGQYVVETLNYLATLDDMVSSEPDYKLGIYGELKWNILSKVSIGFGYRLPWEYENGELSMNDEDYFKAVLEVKKGVIPVLGLHGSVFYARSYFIPTLIGKSGYEDMNLFDGYTVFGGELIYPVAPTLDLALVFTKTVKQNDGVTEFDANGQPVVVPSISIETRVHF